MSAGGAQDPTPHWGLRPEFDHLGGLQRHVSLALRARTGPQNLICLCSSYARTAMDAVGEHSSRDGIRVSVVESDPRTARSLREHARSRHVVLDVVAGDAGSTDAYLDAVPADVVLASGSLADSAAGSLSRTTSAIRLLCAEGATIVWSHALSWPDRAREARRLFGSDSFTEISTDRVGEHTRWPGWLVGSSGIVPLPFAPGVELFDEVSGTTAWAG